MSLLESSTAPAVIEPRPLWLGTPGNGSPELTPLAHRLSPAACKPPLLAKRARTIWPRSRVTPLVYTPLITPVSVNEKLASDPAGKPSWLDSRRLLGSSSTTELTWSELRLNVGGGWIVGRGGIRAVGGDAVG